MYIDCSNAFINIALVIPHYLRVHEGGCGYGDCAVELRITYKQHITGVVCAASKEEFPPINICKVTYRHQVF